MLSLSNRLKEAMPILECGIVTFYITSTTFWLLRRPETSNSTMVCPATTIISSWSRQIVQLRASQRMRLTVGRQYGHLLSTPAFVMALRQHLTAVEVTAFICRCGLYLYVFLTTRLFLEHRIVILTTAQELQRWATVWP